MMNRDKYEGKNINISLGETEEDYEIFFFSPILDLCQVRFAAPEYLTNLPLSIGGFQTLTIYVLPLK
jgi:hypothetical protein